MGSQREKYIAKLTPKRKKICIEVIARIISGNVGELDIVKMQGDVVQYRCRVGSIRIVYQKVHGKNKIIKIGSRGDIYKK